MLAACLNAQSDIKIKEFSRPSAPHDGVVVEMHFASICGSDVHIVFDGLHDPARLGKPGYPGHEGVGIVVESCSEEFSPGTRVLTVPPGPAGGCFAEFQAVGKQHLLAVPPGMPMQNALMGQQLGTTVFALKKFLPQARRDSIKSAAVIGAGSAGLFFLQQLRLAGIEVIISDLDPKRLEQATRLGAARAVLAGPESLVDVAKEFTGGKGCDLVIEAAGYDLCREEAIEIASNGGVVGLFGYAERPGLSPFPVHRAFRKSLTVEWVSGAQSEPDLASFEAALRMIDEGQIKVDYCLESFFPLTQLTDALEVARAYGNGAAKIGLTIGSRLTDKPVGLAEAVR